MPQSKIGLGFKFISKCIAGLTLVTLVFLNIVLPLYPDLRCSSSAGSDAFVPSELPSLWFIADPQIVADVPESPVFHFLNNRMNDIFYTLLAHIMQFRKGPFYGKFVLGDIQAYQFYRDDLFDNVAYRVFSMFAMGAKEDESVLSSDHWADLRFIAGNHDLGYARELRLQNIKRFENTYNQRLWSDTIVFPSDKPPVLLVACDGLELDGELRSNTSWEHLQSFVPGAFSNREGLPVILLLHIPLWKPPGSCPGDEPQFTYFRGQVAQQNTLSKATTDWILGTLKPAAVLTGHDHEGCTFIHEPHGTPEWTLRAVQGDYGGNTGVLTIGHDARGSVLLHMEQCPFFTTRLILVAVITLPVSLLILVLLSCCTTWVSRKEKYE
ncbi:Protein TED1 [Diplonema papillatum]|nr:Protein TED1 [Diplonema papillatum]